MTPGGLVYHVLSRTVAGLPLFHKLADYQAFERIIVEALQRHPLRILACCLMPNQWQEAQAKRLGLMHTFRSEGRPKRTVNASDRNN